MHQLEVVAILFALKLMYPERVYLLRGNHEFRDMNEKMGEDGFLYNKYYPSPEMHALAAEMLTPACLRVTGG